MATRKAYSYLGAPPKCHDCDKALPSSKPRLTIKGSWMCPGCAYLLDHPNAQLRPSAPEQPTAA